MPRRDLGVTRLHDEVACARVVIPFRAGEQISRTELPLTQWIIDPCRETPFLFLIAYFEPVFDQFDSTGHDITLELWAQIKKPPMLFLRAKAQHIFHSCTVVPAAIKNDDFA